MFRLTIDKLHDPKAPRACDHAFQERNIIAQSLSRVAGAMSSTEIAGEISYDGRPIGSWEFVDGSHVHREHVKRDGPGTWAALQRDPDEKARHDEANARQALAAGALRR